MAGNRKRIIEICSENNVRYVLENSFDIFADPVDIHSLGLDKWEKEDLIKLIEQLNKDLTYSVTCWEGG